MFELTPKRTNTTARKMILLFFLGSAALIVTTMLVPTVPFRWIFQLVAVLLLTAGVFLTTRYVTKLFIYRIQDGDLTVTEANSNGKRQITVCRVGLSGILSVTEQDTAGAAKEQIQALKKKRVKLFDYTVDLEPARSIFVIVSEGGEELALRLSYDEALLALLKDAVSDKESSEFKDPANF